MCPIYVYNAHSTRCCRLIQKKKNPSPRALRTRVQQDIKNMFMKYTGVGKTDEEHTARANRKKEECARARVSGKFSSARKIQEAQSEEECCCRIPERERERALIARERKKNHLRKVSPSYPTCSHARAWYLYTIHMQIAAEESRNIRGASTRLHREILPPLGRHTAAAVYICNTQSCANLNSCSCARVEHCTRQRESVLIRNHNHFLLDLIAR